MGHGSAVSQSVNQSVNLLSVWSSEFFQKTRGRKVREKRRFLCNNAFMEPFPSMRRLEDLKAMASWAVYLLIILGVSIVSGFHSSTRSLGGPVYGLKKTSSPSEMEEGEVDLLHHHPSYITFVSSNKHKIQEVETILGTDFPLKIRSHSVDLSELQDLILSGSTRQLATTASRGCCKTSTTSQVTIPLAKHNLLAIIIITTTSTSPSICAVRAILHARRGPRSAHLRGRGGGQHRSSAARPHCRIRLGPHFPTIGSHTHVCRDVQGGEEQDVTSFQGTARIQVLPQDPPGWLRDFHLHCIHYSILVTP
eukprot:scaffold1046_cov162-Ochromonas_danica.AAC.3